MRILIGKVTSKLGEKTAKVAVERVVVHPIYKKRYKRSRNYLVHDEINLAVGDEIKFSDSKPYSKTKRWKAIERIKK